jgi:antitoxin (DNA-binding transcriptional repressor) of toxin-antitoxin stability system
MSNSIPIEQAAIHLAELVGKLRPGDEIVLTEHNQPVARILPNRSKLVRRKAGSCKGMLIVLQEDDEHLKDFGEYMP